MSYKSTRRKDHVYQCIKLIWPNKGEVDERGFPIFCSLSPETLEKLDCAAAKLQICFPDLHLYEIKELVFQLLNWKYDTQLRGFEND